MGKIKEFLKDWLVEHERLYWYIVVGFAVLAFGIITMLGLAKLEKAEAATTYDGNYYPDLLNEVDLGDLREQILEIIDSGKYVVVSKPNATEFYYMFAKEPVYPGWYSGGLYGLQNTSKVVGVVSYTPSNGFVQVKTVSTVVYIHDGSTTCAIGSNYDYRGGEAKLIDCPYENMEYPVKPIPVEYSSSAPYLDFDKRTGLNLFFMDGNRDFTLSTLKHDFNLVNSSDEPFENRLVEFSGYVYLPSKTKLDEFITWSTGGNTVLEKYMSILKGDYYPQWTKLLDSSTNVVGKKWYFEFSVDCLSDYLEVTLSYEDIISLVESCNNISLAEYYDIEDYVFIIDLMKAYMWVQRLDGIVYTTYEDRIEYGNVSSFLFSAYLSEPIASVGNSDPNFVGPMLPDSDIQGKLEQAYKDAIEEARKENDILNDTLDGLYDTQGAYGSLEGSDLWKSFSSLADGLAGMAPSVRAIASLSGAVLAFMPLQITGIISFTLVALCIIAIIKAIRG